MRLDTERRARMRLVRFSHGQTCVIHSLWSHERTQQLEGLLSQRANSFVEQNLRAEDDSALHLGTVMRWAIRCLFSL